MRNLIKLNREWRRKRHQLSELDAFRNEALWLIAGALSGLSERLTEIDLDPLSTRQIADAAAAMRKIVLDATDGAESGLALERQRLELEIELECVERGLHDGKTRNELQNAEHARTDLRATIRNGRSAVEHGALDAWHFRHCVAGGLQRYRHHMREAFRPVEQPRSVPAARPVPMAAE